MGPVGTLELPARISPCLRLFVEMLFEEVDVKQGASWHQNHEVKSSIPKVIQTNDPLRDEGQAYSHKLMDAGVAGAATRYDGMIHDHRLAITLQFKSKLGD